MDGAGRRVCRGPQRQARQTKRDHHDPPSVRGIRHAQAKAAGHVGRRGTGALTRTVAIVGLGAAARNIHLPAYRKLPGLRVVGGADVAADAGAWPFPVFHSLEAMLARVRPDIVVVATPPGSHCALACAALRAGCHVFCEKPFVESLDEADAVIEAARQADRLVAVNNEFRYMRCHMAARAQIGGAAFGRLLFVSMSQTFRVTGQTEAGWRGQDTRRTAKDFGPHVLDLCRFFFGEDPRSIRARMPRVGRIDGPDHLNLIELEFSGDRVAHITLDRLSRGAHRYLDIRLDGETACVETSIGGKLQIRVGLNAATRRPFAGIDIAMGGRAQLWTGERAAVLAVDRLDLFADASSRLMADFLIAIERGTAAPCDAADSRRTLALMLAAYQSDRTGAPVVMRYEPSAAGP